MPDNETVVHDGTDDPEVEPIMAEIDYQFLEAMDRIFEWLPDAYYDDPGQRESVVLINGARQMWLRGLLMGVFQPDFAREVLQKTHMLDDVNKQAVEDTVAAIREKEANAE